MSQLFKEIRSHQPCPLSLELEGARQTLNLMRFVLGEIILDLHHRHSPFSFATCLAEIPHQGRFRDRYGYLNPSCTVFSNLRLCHNCRDCHRLFLCTTRQCHIIGTIARHRSSQFEQRHCIDSREARITMHEKYLNGTQITINRRLAVPFFFLSFSPGRAATRRSGPASRRFVGTMVRKVELQRLKMVCSLVLASSALSHSFLTPR
jgi:hypothetical protein